MPPENQEQEQDQDVTPKTDKETKQDPPVDKEGEGTSEDESQDQIDWQAKYKELEGKVEGLASKKDELLGKVKDYKTKLQEIEESKKNEKFKEAEQNGDKDKLLEFARQEVAELRDQIKEIEDKEQERKEGLLHQKKVMEFKKKLGDVEFYNEKDALDSVDFSQFVLEEESGSFNEKGVKEAVDKFLDQYYYKIKDSKSNPNHAKPKGGDAGKKHDTKEALRKWRNGEL